MSAAKQSAPSTFMLSLGVFLMAGMLGTYLYSDYTGEMPRFLEAFAQPSEAIEGSTVVDLLQDSTVKQHTMLPYYHDDFYINYPADWLVYQPETGLENETPELIFSSAAVANPNDSENLPLNSITLTKVSLNKTETLGNYLSEKTNPFSEEQHSFETAKVMTSSGLATKVRYTHTLEDNSSLTETYYYFTLSNADTEEKVLYRFHHTCRSGHEDLIDQMINSLQFNQNLQPI